MDSRDHLYDRLFRPDAVPEPFRHLCDDDKARVHKIASFRWMGTVLDAGCGDGTLLAQTWAKSSRMTDGLGIEIDPTSLAEAKSFWPKAPIQWVQHDLSKPWPIGAESCQGALCCEVLEHVDAKTGTFILQNIRRVLRPKSLVCVTVPNREPATHYVEQNRSRWDWPTHVRTLILPDLLKQLRPHFKNLKAHGLYPGDAVNRGIWLIVTGRT
jgi:SAM-dependent methyltransferase